MTRVIVCGARSSADLGMLLDAAVDGVGLITEVWQELSCKLRREETREFARLLPPLVSSVLIVTEENVDEVLRMADFVRPDVLQLHGPNPPEDIRRMAANLKAKLVKALLVDKEGRLAGGGEPGEVAQEYLQAGASAIVLDSIRPGKVGATGEMSSLELARGIRDRIRPAPLILAGGLNPSNVAAAIQTVRPYAVDVLSGVLTNGYLDPPKVTQFMEEVRRADTQNRTPIAR
jgi:phosphoribosylanthranilate isomerase